MAWKIKISRHFLGGIKRSDEFLDVFSVLRGSNATYIKIFLGAKAPLGSLEVKVKVKVKPRKGP